MWGREKPSEQAASNRRQGSARGGAAVKPIETIIGPNTHVKGDIQGDGGLRVEGIVEGNIETTGNLVISESAKVLAEVKAKNVSIAGAVRGNIEANRVEILDTGRVWGDLTIKSLLINEGAYLRGQTYMPQDLEPPQIESITHPKRKLPVTKSVSPAAKPSLETKKK
ncbi:MAG: polymer-forming cytoskeletal protein [Chloroflexota bacterium]|nr:polymer-forming cytoskeletal protein [Chloroflexota bacterium]